MDIQSLKAAFSQILIRAVFGLISTIIAILVLDRVEKYLNTKLFFRKLAAKRQKRESWLVFSDEDTIILQNPRVQQTRLTIFITGFLVMPFVCFVSYAINVPFDLWGSIVAEYWYFIAIGSWIAFSIAWLFMQLSGSRTLEIDRTRRTYKYTHQRAYKLPAQRKLGRLTPASAVQVYYTGRLTFIILSPQYFPGITGGYTLGTFTEYSEAMRFGQEIATDLGLKVINAGIPVIDNPIVTIQNRRKKNRIKESTSNILDRVNHICIR